MISITDVLLVKISRKMALCSKETSHVEGLGRIESRAGLALTKVVLPTPPSPTERRDREISGRGRVYNQRSVLQRIPTTGHEE